MDPCLWNRKHRELIMNELILRIYFPHVNKNNDVDVETLNANLI